MAAVAHARQRLPARPGDRRPPAPRAGHCRRQSPPRRARADGVRRQERCRPPPGGRQDARPQSRSSRCGRAGAVPGARRIPRGHGRARRNLRQAVARGRRARRHRHRGSAAEARRLFLAAGPRPRRTNVPAARRGAPVPARHVDAGTRDGISGRAPRQAGRGRRRPRRREEPPQRGGAAIRLRARSAASGGGRPSRRSGGTPARPQVGKGQARGHRPAEPDLRLPQFRQRAGARARGAGARPGRPHPGPRPRAAGGTDAGPAVACGCRGARGLPGGGFGLSAMPGPGPVAPDVHGPGRRASPLRRPSSPRQRAGGARQRALPVVLPRQDDPAVGCRDRQGAAPLRGTRRRSPRSAAARRPRAVRLRGRDAAALGSGQRQGDSAGSWGTMAR